MSIVFFATVAVISVVPAAAFCDRIKS